jgi:hypothetical protein
MNLKSKKLFIYETEWSINFFYVNECEGSHGEWISQFFSPQFSSIFTSQPSINFSPFLLNLRQNYMYGPLSYFFVTL